MVKVIWNDIVASGSYPHSLRVEDAIEKLQSSGYNITQVDRISKMKLGIFGEDITHIYYEKKKNEKN